MFMGNTLWKDAAKLNQSEQLYGTGKTHKFDSIKDIILENLEYLMRYTLSTSYLEYV